MRKKVLLSLCSLLACAPAQAGWIGVFGENPYPLVKDGPGYYNLGFEFQVNQALTQAITVYALGSYMAPWVSQEDQEVGLWEETASGATLLASAVVTTADQPWGNWVFRDIAPVVLTAGKTYVVGSQGNRNQAWDSGYAAAPFITGISNRFATFDSSANNPLVYPAETEAGVTFLCCGGNLEYEVGSSVPEPGTLLLVVGGLLVAGLRRLSGCR